MQFLKSITVRDDIDGETSGFPFTVPTIEALTRLEFSAPVTFLVGENGSGKSTLLEAIACALKCPAIGSADVASDPMLAAQQELARHLRVVRGGRPRVKLFFRAEDAIGFTRRVGETNAELAALKDHFDRTLTGYGRQLATGAMEGQSAALRERYGDNPDACSHGEWFLNVLRERIRDKGLYLLDEPETPLSPIHQLSLLSIIKEAVAGGCQFIIATHSPILMALPQSDIVSFDHIPPQNLTWDEVEHVNLTRAFLNDPDSFLRHL